MKTERAIAARAAGWAVALAAAWAGPAAAAEDPCPAYRHTLAFFNGVWNTPDAAAASAQALREALVQGLARDPGPAYDPRELAVEVFYNASGLQRGLSGGIEDFVEVFQQRAAELDAGLQDHWELFWETVGGGADYWRRASADDPAAQRLQDSLEQARRADLLAQTTALAAQPPTAFDYAAHRIRLRALSAQGRGVLMVGHSQGNFFLNRAYRTTPGPAVAAVHIAPASVQTSGPYLLSDHDAVIDALRAMVPGDPPPPNLSLPFSWADPSGHALIASYLDPDRPGRAAVGRLLAGQLRILPQLPAQADPGLFTATLTWDGPGDLDLHVFEPGGAHVYYGAPRGAAGMLDLDDTTGTGPEHYHASCDADRLQAGDYRIAINHYAGAQGRIATLQLASAARGVLRTLRLPAGPERGAQGDAAPDTALHAVVQRQASGAWTVRAQ